MIAGAMNIFALIIFIAAIVALIRFFRPRSEDHQQISRKKQPAAILTGDEDVLIRGCPAYILLYQFSPKDTGQSKVK